MDNATINKIIESTPDAFAAIILALDIISFKKPKKMYRLIFIPTKIKQYNYIHATGQFFGIMAVLLLIELVLLFASIRGGSPKFAMACYFVGAGILTLGVMQYIAEVQNNRRMDQANELRTSGVNDDVVDKQFEDDTYEDTEKRVHWSFIIISIISIALSRTFVFMGP